MKEPDEIDVMISRISLILRLGSTIVDFAVEYLEFDLSPILSTSAEFLRKAYKMFFTAPTPNLVPRSIMMYAHISHIPEIDSINELVDQLIQIYICFFHLRVASELSDLIDKRDKTGLALLLKDAPQPKAYEKKLLSIIGAHLHN